MSDAVQQQAAPVKVVKQVKKTVAKVSKPKVEAKHPKFREMILEAIKKLAERSGSSRQAILKYIVANFHIEEKLANQHMKIALKQGVKQGWLKQIKGVGASGSFRVGDAAKVVKPKVVKKVAAPKTVKPKVAKLTTKPKKNVKKITKPAVPKPVAAAPIAKVAAPAVAAKKPVAAPKKVVKKVAAPAAKAASPAKAAPAKKATPVKKVAPVKKAAPAKRAAAAK